MGGEGHIVRVELLYFDECPSYLVAAERLRQIVTERGPDISIEMVRVETDEEARRLRFPGSPTIRADGEDLFPTGGQVEGTLSCRVYATPVGLSGSPTAGMIAEALGRCAGTGA